MSKEAEYENSQNKTSLSEWKEAVISLAAFATSGGGAVHFGVNPEGKRVGIRIGKNSLENLANDIKRNTGTPTFPSIQVQKDLTVMVRADLLIIEGKGPTTRYLVRD